LIGRSTDTASASVLAVDLIAIDKNKTISRQHASVSENGGLFTIQRLAEGNPVIVDGVQIGYLSPVPLRDRSSIKIGSVTLIFYVEDNAEYVKEEV